MLKWGVYLNPPTSIIVPGSKHLTQTFAFWHLKAFCGGRGENILFVTTADTGRLQIKNPFSKASSIASMSPPQLRHLVTVEVLSHAWVYFWKIRLGPSCRPNLRAHAHPKPTIPQTPDTKEVGWGAQLGMDPHPPPGKAQAYRLHSRGFTVNKARGVWGCLGFGVGRAYFPLHALAD